MVVDRKNYYELKTTNSKLTMGKTKTKFIDDSQPTEEVKAKPEPKKEVKDTLVEKLKAELGIEEKKLEVVKETKEKTEETQKETKKKYPASKAKPRSKKYQEVSKDLDRSKSYPINEAIEQVKKVSYSKFDNTLEAHINTAQAGIRGLISLPYFTGKKLRILAFGNNAGTSGADIIGDDSVLEEISKGKLDFDLLLTTPDWMPKLAKVAKILGPRGLMPNPKSNTIVDTSTEGLKKAVTAFQSGKTEYKSENKANVIHLGLGKLSQPSEELSANVKTLLTAIGKTKIKKVSLSPTMGPSVKIDLSSL